MKSFYFCVFLFSFFVFGGCDARGEKEIILTAHPSRGPFEEKLILSAVVDAVHSLGISAPGFDRDFKLIYLVKEGTDVKKGDLVARYDSTKYKEALENIEESIISKQNEIDNLETEHKETLNSLSNAIVQKNDAITLENINLEALKFAPKADQIKGRINYNTRLNEYSNAVSKYLRTKANNRRILSKRQDELKRRLYKKKEILEKIAACTVRAPQKGLIVYLTRHPWAKEKVALGDSLRQRHHYLNIPSLDSMMVKMEVHEIHIHRLKKGVPCRVVLEAFPEMTYRATISSIGALARPKVENNEITVFDVEAIIEEHLPEKMKPGMTARVEVIISSYPDVVFLPIDTIFKNEKNRGILYQLQGRKLIKQVFDLGGKNDDFVIIRESLSTNQTFVLYHPDLERKNFELKGFNIQENTQTGSKLLSPDEESTEGEKQKERGQGELKRGAGKPGRTKADKEGSTPEEVSPKKSKKRKRERNWKGKGRPDAETLKRLLQEKTKGQKRKGSDFFSTHLSNRSSR